MITTPNTALQDLLNAEAAVFEAEASLVSRESQPLGRELLVVQRDSARRQYLSLLASQKREAAERLSEGVRPEDLDDSLSEISNLLFFAKRTLEAREQALQAYLRRATEALEDAQAALIQARRRWEQSENDGPYTRLEEASGYESRSWYVTGGGTSDEADVINPFDD